MPRTPPGLAGEAPSEAGGLGGTSPEGGLGLGVARGGGGLLGGAEARWVEALFLGCSAPSLEARVRRTTSGAGDEGCTDRVRTLSGDAGGERGGTSSWDASASVVAEGWTSLGPLQAGRGSSSSELASDSSSAISSSFEGSCFTSQLSSPWAAPGASSSSVADSDSISLVKDRAEGLVGEVRGLETADVRTGAEMTKERLLLLDSPFTTKTLLECCFSSLLITSYSWWFSLLISL